MVTYTCPVCGFDGLTEPSRTPGCGGSYEICPSCGFQFGVTDEDRGIGYSEWRQDWLARGMPWDSQGIEPNLADWNPRDLLARLLASDDQPALASPIDEVVSRLRSAGCVFAEDEARVLLDASRSTDQLDQMTARRVAGEPLEYVVGFADFCGVRVRLDPGVFIPRQRTELLVRAAAELAPPDAVCLDLCCGSGALGLAFAHLVPKASVHAADIDPVAAQCSRRNLPDVYESDLFAALPGDLRGRIDVLLANVPYVPTGELTAMPIEARDHEPAATHDGGADGLDVLRRMLTDARGWLSPGGHVLTELADAQLHTATEAFTKHGFDVRVAGDEDTTVAIGTIRH